MSAGPTAGSTGPTCAAEAQAGAHGPSAACSALVTGFGPFPGVDDNPTAAIAAAIGQLALPDVALAVLPVSWRRGPEALRAALDATSAEVGPPVVLLHLGVAVGADRLRVERVAAAACRQALDVDGDLPTSTPSAGAARFDAEALARHLGDAGLPAAVSDDAGAYLCNAIFAEGLRWAAARDVLVAFLHVPMPGTPRPDGAPWQLADLVSAATTTLTWLQERGRVASGRA